MEDSLNLRDVRIYDTIEDADGKERRVLNAKETTLAAQKQQAIPVSYTHLMQEYGYSYDGMLPVTRERALELDAAGLTVYVLHEDNTCLLYTSRCV